jgi:hypothetical protein
MDYSDTPDSWAKRLMDFRRHAPELTELSRVPKRTRRDRCSFHCHMELIVRDFLIGGTLGNRLVNYYETF